MTTRRRRSSDWRIAVPTYQRPAVLAARTLPWLLGGGIPPDRVTVFCHDGDPDADGYAAAADATGVRVVATPTRGIRAQRAAILDHYPPGTPLVQVDDDVSDLMEVAAGRLRSVADIGAFAVGMFRETAARDLWVWGVAPVANAFYLREGKLSEGLKFCIGTVWGCYTRPGHPVHAGRAELKEDYELSLRAWWYDGAVLRADGAAPRAAHYTAGGCAETRSRAVEEAAVAVLEEGFPGLVRRNPRRVDPYPEVLLARRPRGTRRPPDCPLPGESVAP